MEEEKIGRTSKDGPAKAKRLNGPGGRGDGAGHGRTGVAWERGRGA